MIMGGELRKIDSGYLVEAQENYFDETEVNNQKPRPELLELVSVQYPCTPGISTE
jgi:hypothetical protein